MDSAPRIVGAVRVVSPRGVLALALRPRLLLRTFSVLEAVVFPRLLLRTFSVLVAVVFPLVFWLIWFYRLRVLCAPAEPTARIGPRAVGGSNIW